jgi:hypothetical protein
MDEITFGFGQPDNQNKRKAERWRVLGAPSTGADHGRNEIPKERRKMKRAEPTTRANSPQHRHIRG